MTLLSAGNKLWFLVGVAWHFRRFSLAWLIVGAMVWWLFVAGTDIAITRMQARPIRQPAVHNPFRPPPAPPLPKYLLYLQLGGAAVFVIYFTTVVALTQRIFRTRPPPRPQRDDWQEDDF